MAASDYVTDVQGLYVAYYGRWADASGLSYWTRVADAEDGNLDAMINAFGTSTEYQETYSEYLDADNEVDDASGLVNELYQNMFDRDGEQEGVDFYVNQLNAGESTFAEIALDIFNGAQGDDKDILDNKVSVAEFATEALQSTGSPYSGADAIATAQATLDSVDATGVSVANAQDSINNTYDAGGQTFTLTTKIDIPQANDGVDRFIAQLDGNSATLGLGDEINGRGGNDRFDIIGDANIAGFADAEVTDVEEIYARFDGANDGQGLDVSANAGVEQVWVNGGTIDGTADTVTLSTGQTAGVEGTVTAETSDNDDLEFTFTEVTGSSDSATLALVDADTTDLDSLTIAGIETLNVALTGTNAVNDLTLTETETLNLSGAGDLTLSGSALDADTETVDASDATGDISIDVSGVNGGNGGNGLGVAAGSLNVTGGSGDDIIAVGNLLSSVDADATFSVDGGEGTDTLGVTADFENTGDIAADVIAAGLSNVENIATDHTALTLTDFEFDSVGLVGDAAGDVTLTDVANGVLNLGIDGTEYTDDNANVTIDNSNADFDDLTELTINSNESTNAISTLAVTGDDNVESLATLNIDATFDLDVDTYKAVGFSDIETGTREDFTLNVEGAAATTFSNLDQDATITRMDLNNAGEGKLTVSELDLTAQMEARLDGEGEIVLSDLAIDGVPADNAVVIQSLGAGDRTIDDISNDADADDIRIRGDNDLTIGSSSSGSEVALADTTDLDASTFTGDLTAFLDRADAADEAYTVQLGSGDDEVTLDADETDGSGNGAFTLAFDGASLGSDTINGFDEDSDNVDDILDFSSFAEGDLGYTVTDGVGTLADDGSDFEVTFEAGDADQDGSENDLIASSDAFEGSVSLIGVAADNLADANFAGTAA